MTGHANCAHLNISVAPLLLISHMHTGECKRGCAMYRFGQVARAVGVGEPTLRNWLQRNEIDLFEPRPETGWLSFTENDVFVLAVAAELIRLGAKVKPAVDAVRVGLAGVNFKTWEGRPDYLFAAPGENGWYASEDENMTATLCGPSLVKIAVPVVMAAARRRLLADRG